MKKLRLFTLATALLLALAVVSGCGGSGQNSPGSNPFQGAGDLEQAAPADSTPTELIDTGSFGGQADSNSIEITLSNGTVTVFALGEVKDSFEGLGLELGDKVSISYYEVKDQQPVLTSIEKAA